jgi:hypothetical protein
MIPPQNAGVPEKPQFQQNELACQRSSPCFECCSTPYCTLLQPHFIEPT